MRLYVHRKLPLRALTLSDRIPPLIDGIPLDIVESPRAYFCHSFLSGIRRCCNPKRRRRVRPILAGVSVGCRNGERGTIACLCRPLDESKTALLLSNAHVLGWFADAQAGESVFQPAAGDGDCNSTDEISKIPRHVPIRTSQGVPNKVDAALAELNPGVQSERTIYKVGMVDGKTNAHDGLHVVKHGGASGFTRGVVTSIDADYEVCQYGNSATKVLFTNQIRIEKLGRRPFSVLGDSGALVVQQSPRRAVGLLFAISDNYSLANHIHDVEAALGILI